MQKLSVRKIQALLDRHPEVRLAPGAWVRNSRLDLGSKELPSPPECCPMSLVLYDAGKLKLEGTHWNGADRDEVPVTCLALFGDYGSGFMAGFDGAWVIADDSAVRGDSFDWVAWRSGLWDGCAARVTFFPNLPHGYVVSASVSAPL